MRFEKITISIISLNKAVILYTLIINTKLYARNVSSNTVGGSRMVTTVRTSMTRRQFAADIRVWTPDTSDLRFSTVRFPQTASGT